VVVIGLPNAVVARGFFLLLELLYGLTIGLLLYGRGVVMDDAVALPTGLLFVLSAVRVDDAEEGVLVANLLLLFLDFAYGFSTGVATFALLVPVFEEEVEEGGTPWEYGLVLGVFTHCCCFAAGAAGAAAAAAAGDLKCGAS